MRTPQFSKYKDIVVENSVKFVESNQCFDCKHGVPDLDKWTCGVINSNRNEIRSNIILCVSVRIGIVEDGLQHIRGCLTIWFDVFGMVRIRDNRNSQRGANYNRNGTFPIKTYSALSTKIHLTITALLTTYGSMCRGLAENFSRGLINNDWLSRSIKQRCYCLG
ncbi:hypothetical protein Tco_1427844 [Tanacetum coccineum]|uniref:Uncharacterized protein n=1 Tax=Tanacetum coccineum TaxID=301880 RepID=A0ABQ5C8F7_9ASTR